MIDGDEIRQVLGLDDGNIDYTLAGRRKVATQICALCAWLDSQNINVVCCTMSFFDDLRQHNRDVLSFYYEVYISVPMDVLLNRDDKGLYARARQGKIKNVIGVDLPFSPPSTPDLIIDNSQYHNEFKDVATHILTAATQTRDASLTHNTI